MLKLVTFKEMQKEVDVEKQNFDTWSKFDQKKVTKNVYSWEAVAQVLAQG